MRKNSKLNRVAQATNGVENIYGSSKERIKLLRRGLSGTNIESLYVRINPFVVLGIDWHDSGVEK